MKSPGEKITRLIADNEANNIHFISPYITISPVIKLLDILNPKVYIKITTCVEQELILNGSTSLAAIKLLHKQPNTELQHITNLHAKVYIAGQKCLIGSANFTDRGLGSSPHANLEFLTEINRQNNDIIDLEREIIKNAQPITEELICNLDKLMDSEKRFHDNWIHDLISIEMKRCGWMPMSDPTSFQKYQDDEGFHNLTSDSKNNIYQDIKFVLNFKGISSSPNRDEFLRLLLSMPMIKAAKRIKILNAEREFTNILHKKYAIKKERIELLLEWADSQ